MSEKFQLINKYNEPVPRYTSYPPANHFSDNFTETDYKSAISESNNQSPENISIYIHIPFCGKLCYYCGCNAVKMPEKKLVEQYIDSLLKEINMVSGLLDKNRKLSQIHYGGGTPNSIPLHYLKQINDIIFCKFSTIDEPEIAIELNPAYIDFNDTDELIDAGFNRFSFGIQDFDLNVLKNVNRDPSYRPIQDIMKHIKLKQPKSMINLDFIYGLPGQTVSSFLDSLKTAVSIRPDRLVTFSYAHVPWVNKTQLILETRGLPTQEEKLEMYYQSKKYLNENGYHSIGFDHYVLDHDELYKAAANNQLHRNFQGYCTRRTTGQVYAFGVSAISQLEKVYSQNEKTVKKYIELINNDKLPVIKGYSLSDTEIIVREVITSFLSNNFINFTVLSKSLNITTEELHNILKIDFDAVNQFKDDGIIDFDGNSIQITDTGLLFIRNVAAALDPGYKVTSQKYSKSV